MPKRVNWAVKGYWAYQIRRIRTECGAKQSRVMTPNYINELPRPLLQRQRRASTNSCPYLVPWLVIHFTLHASELLSKALITCSLCGLALLIYMHFIKGLGQ